VSRGGEGNMKVCDFHVVVVVQQCLNVYMRCECMTSIATWFDGLVDLPTLSSQRGFGLTCCSASLSPLFSAANSRDTLAQLQHKIVSTHEEVVIVTSRSHLHSFDGNGKHVRGVFD
jgi:hypothetical protein